MLRKSASLFSALWSFTSCPRSRGSWRSDVRFLSIHRPYLGTLFLPIGGQSHRFADFAQTSMCDKSRSRTPQYTYLDAGGGDIKEGMSLSYLLFL
ncbi:hypothetical protein FB451DRAFT_429947 [Mycena latifolia]|nr:hypothetical protein FB451DRAFT_429947 [Mycena latifolia]